MINLLKSFFIIVVTFSIISCSNEPEKPNIQKKEGKKSGILLKIGFIIKDFNDKYSLKKFKTIDKFAKQHNLEIIETTSKTNKALLNNLDLLKNKGVKGIIVSVPDPRLGPSIVSRSKRLGIKIISIQNRFLNIDGTYMQKVPHIGISIEKTSNMISDTVLNILNERKWNISNTAILFLKENSETLYQDCINLTCNILKKNDVQDSNIIIETPIPSPNGLIVSFPNLQKIRAQKYKNVIIYGFNMNTVIRLLKILETSYKHEYKNVTGFSTDFLSDSSKGDIPSNYYGSIHINLDECAYKTTELMYNWIAKDEKPPLNYEVPIRLIKNPKYK